LESELAAAEERMKRLHFPGRKKQEEVPQDTYDDASEALLKAERRLAAAKGEPYAIPADFPVDWEPGAPLPILLTSDYKLFLIFCVQDKVDWSNEQQMAQRFEKLFDQRCVVTFLGCADTRFGCPNEEVWHGHYLDGHGQDGNEAQIVVHSPWLNEVMAINSVHSDYRPERWTDKKHYIFWFHDTTFECLAEGLTWEVVTEPIDQILVKLTKELI